MSNLPFFHKLNLIIVLVQIRQMFMLKPYQYRWHVIFPQLFFFRFLLGTDQPIEELFQDCIKLIPEFQPLIDELSNLLGVPLLPYTVAPH